MFSLFNMTEEPKIKCTIYLDTTEFKASEFVKSGIQQVIEQYSNDLKVLESDTLTLKKAEEDLKELTKSNKQLIDQLRARVYELQQLKII